MSEKTIDNPRRTLVLASTSRYRRELLARLGVAFEISPPGVEEATYVDELPAAAALRLAEAKARAVAAKYGNALVIGSDQVADAGGRHIGKPGNHAQAVAQLSALSGRTVTFHTGVALIDAASGRCHTEVVDVVSTFRVLSRETIERYLLREQPYDCAGAVKSESLGIVLFEKIESDDPTALIGLPLITVVSLLRAEGVDVLSDDVIRVT